MAVDVDDVVVTVVNVIDVAASKEQVSQACFDGVGMDETQMAQVVVKQGLEKRMKEVGLGGLKFGGTVRWDG